MNKKITNNAICAYFWLGLLLLIPNKNPNVNNDFVKSHSKTASFLHLWFLITYIIFISYWLFWNIHILGFWLNNIIAPIIFLILFIFLIYWSFKANKWDNFLVKDVTDITKTKNFIEIKKSNLNEEWIVTIVLSLVPLLWFIIKWKFLNYKSKIIENNLKLNLVLTLIIYIFFLTWYNNLWVLLILWLSIFIVFYWVFIIINKNIINFNIDWIPTFEELIQILIWFIKYMINYFWKNKFKKISEFIDNEKIKRKNFLEINNNNIPKKEATLNNIIYFLPFINLIWFIDYNSKNKYIVINWLIITVLSSIILLINNDLQFLIVILAFFWYGYSKHLNYQFPILGNIYNYCEKIFKKIFWISIEISKNSEDIEEKVFKM